MRIGKLIAGLSAAGFGLIPIGGLLLAQAPQAATPVLQPKANLLQLMRSIFFVNSNVYFAAQGQNPAEVKTAPQASAATDPLTGSFGQWEAVENSALAVAESANLLMIPGRKCANGRDVPLGNADWQQFVTELRDAGMAAYKAAQSKDQEKIFQAADLLTTACTDCHRKYRSRVMANRCQ